MTEEQRGMFLSGFCNWLSFVVFDFIHTTIYWNLFKGSSMISSFQNFRLRHATEWEKCCSLHTLARKNLLKSSQHLWNNVPWMLEQLMVVYKAWPSILFTSLFIGQCLVPGASNYIVLIYNDRNIKWINVLFFSSDQRLQCKHRKTSVPFLRLHCVLLKMSFQQAL